MPAPGTPGIGDTHVLGRYLRAAGHIPVITGNGRAAFEEAKRLLGAGQTVTIFPEGSISPLEGGFYPARTGVARLALSTGAPVIPVGIHLDRERIQHWVGQGAKTTEAVNRLLATAKPAA